MAPPKKRMSGWTKGLIAIAAALVVLFAAGGYAIWTITRGHWYDQLIEQCRGAVSIQFNKSTSARFFHETPGEGLNGTWVVTGEVTYVDNYGFPSHDHYRCVADDKYGTNAQAQVS